ncbi:head-tail connector protein [Lacticaseibacillus nasuensis]|uniref:head-tail connector protein n=1 Tax=Lacticaseibacillus nasuensis TaxID=944671 RepID=UPI002245155C|nr:head-tail connector protein [Lacticaseibacillus nasuensis]MCX2455627.1 head-tail connector protein [Lacticaseibacillus nasuensis]
MGVTVDDLKTSLYLDEVDEGETQRLQDSLDAAESYVQDAVGAPDDFFTDNPNYKIAVLAIAGSYYQNPVSVIVGGGAVVNVDLVSANIINQLRGRWEVSQYGATSDTAATDAEN